MFKKYISDKLFNIFSLFYKKSDSIIDPLTCLIRLAILNFKPHNTKISIKDNRITYNDPNILQGTIRWTNGDNREDIHNIYNPIIKAIKWYNLEDENIITILRYSIKGLQKLKESYEINSTIVHSIDYYIKYIEDNMTKEQETFNEDNTLFIKIKNLWNFREINIVNNILLELEDNKKESLIEALEIILSKKEDSVSTILFNNTTKLE